MTDTRRSFAGILAAVTAFLLPVAYSPSVEAPFWSPKLAVLLVAGGLGLPVLLSLRHTTLRRASVAALAYLAVAAAATAAAPEPVAAVVGLYNWGTGLVFLGACVGVWTLGSIVPEQERPFVANALVLGVALSGAVALLQTLDLVPVASLEATGRASGLAGNAVHLGTLAVGATVIAALRTRNDARWAAAVACAAVVAQLSGTRFALILTVVLGCAIAARSGVRAGAALVLALAGGMVVGLWLAGVGDLQSASARAADDGSASVVAGGGTRVRLEVWGYARHAVGRRPLLGAGPGRFRAATSADRTLDVAQYEGGDSIYSDAHNIVVEHLVTTGVLGAAALLAWLALAFRRARGELAWFAAAVLLMSFAQPLSVGTTPLLFLALGCAAVSTDVPRLAVGRSLALGAAGLTAAMALVVGDVRLNAARMDFDLAAVRSADTLLRPWPQPATIRARLHSFESISDPAAHRPAIAWRLEALERDPTDPLLAVLLADQERVAGRSNAAERHYQLALEHNPWSTSALAGLARLRQDAGDLEGASRYARRALRVRPNRALRAIVERADDAKRPGP